MIYLLDLNYTLIWASRSIWNPRLNFDDYKRQEAHELDHNFDLVANAWERAIQHFHKEYSIEWR